MNAKSCLLWVTYKLVRILYKRKQSKKNNLQGVPIKNTYSDNGYKKAINLLNCPKIGINLLNTPDASFSANYTHIHQL